MHAKLVSGLAAALASVAQARPSPSSNALEARDQQSNTVWCGPVLAAAAQSASAEWKVPSVSLPSPNNGPAPSFYQWVGIDGFGTKCNDALLQVGTSQVVCLLFFSSLFFFSFSLFFLLPLFSRTQPRQVLTF